MSSRVLLGLSVLLPLSAAGQSGWELVSPDRAGFDAAKLHALQSDLSARRTKALLIVRRGKIVCEWYAPGNNPATRQGTASLAKALVGGLSLLVAMNAGRIAPGDLAAKYIPAWRHDPRKSRITIRQLATHSSGIEDAEQGNLPHASLGGWKGAFWRRDPNPIAIAIHDAPVLFEPGTRFEYSNPGMGALAYAITAGLHGTALPDIGALLRETIMRPLGIADSEWSVGYNGPYETDGLNVYADWGGAAFTPRAAAKLALLMLQRGEWNRRQLIARRSVDRALAYAGTPLPGGPMDTDAPASGLGWWINTNGGWRGVPKDAFGGAGAGHQVVVAIPSLDLIVVRNGQRLDTEMQPVAFWPPVVEYLLRPLLQAIACRDAYPPSRAIRAVRFADPGSIVRKAIDSDNWPLTWGDDGEMYAAYGDGFGFEPRVEKKLSLGFARIGGSAADFRGVNIRSATGERTGDGPRGLKASGMLMASSVIYMWVRNAGNAQIAWSADHGRTWEWGFRFEQGFGSPSFLNFGRNYAGARDDYIYTYSQNGGSAYEIDDSLLLARVPKARLRQKDAWEFLERLDDAGKPLWTPYLDRRGEVFRYPRHCGRVDAVYDPALKLYLLAVAYNQAGSWGLYDAPEPWGPWSTAFRTGNWGVGGTHGYRLPAKWISPDGRTLSLVFSGLRPFDAFCVRGMTLDLP